MCIRDRFHPGLQPAGAALDRGQHFLGPLVRRGDDGLAGVVGKPGRGQPPGCAAPKNREPRTEGLMKLQRYGQTPVSYTHLRAHETVLDLVCRLLLEKKIPQALDRCRLSMYVCDDARWLQQQYRHQQ